MQITTLVVEREARITKLSSHLRLKYLIEHNLPGEDGGRLIDYPTQETNFYSLMRSRTVPPDLIILEDFPFYGTGNWLKLLYAWGGVPFVVKMSGETFQLRFTPFNYKLSYQADSPNNRNFHFYLNSPFVAPMLFPATNAKEKEKQLKKAIEFSIYTPRQMQGAYMLRENLLSNPKDKFCNFIYSHGYEKNYPGTGKRKEICRALMDYKRVDCAGKIMNNTSELQEMDAAPPDWMSKTSKGLLGSPAETLPIWDVKLRYISRFKFTIAGENEDYPGYITEKILHPLVVGSIPIYWGTQYVTKLVNPKAFVNCNDYGSLDEVVARVKEIDQNPKLYREYIEANPFHKDSIAYDYSKKRLRQRLDPMYEKLKKHKQKHSSRKTEIASYGTARRALTVLSYFLYKKPLPLWEILLRGIWFRAVGRFLS